MSLVVNVWTKAQRCLVSIELVLLKVKQAFLCELSSRQQTAWRQLGSYLSKVYPTNIGIRGFDTCHTALICSYQKCTCALDGMQPCTVSPTYGGSAFQVPSILKCNLSLLMMSSLSMT